MGNLQFMHLSLALIAVVLFSYYFDDLVYLKKLNKSEPVLDVPTSIVKLDTTLKPPHRNGVACEGISIY
ncbi:hypothetical protein [Vibrio sp. LaRot3]|uniref:hypothetical protein n=1 Tax=Vibrio sp. LaRot3 TaxID=2998829 RepID=UPI0022CDC6D0|nr:hypothetical protein [Vibrio sp. LaRot3]MDA0150181.1 hypothetical protein [Vibrio sp. LaRot3]